MVSSREVSLTVSIEKSLNKPIGDVSTIPWSKRPVCGLSNVSDRRRLILESGDNISLWAAAVVVGRLCATYPWGLILTTEFNSSLSQCVGCVYYSPLFQFHGGHGLAICRLVLTSKDTIIPDAGAGCDICQPSCTLRCIITCLDELF